MQSPTWLRLMRLEIAPKIDSYVHTDQASGFRFSVLARETWLRGWGTEPTTFVSPHQLFPTSILIPPNIPTNQQIPKMTTSQTCRRVEEGRIRLDQEEVTVRRS